MSKPFEFTEFEHTARTVTNKYRKIDSENTLLTIKDKKGTYNFTTVVDTRMVAELQHFGWFRVNTPSGIYFGTSMGDSMKRHLNSLSLADAANDTLLLHRFIAYVVIPNTDIENATYVDHIDRQYLDNRVKNLRWATQSLQNRNRDKKKRHHNACALPNDITLKKLPLYLQWRCESEKMKYFVIECHPALKIGKVRKSWSSTKSQKVSNQDKLEQALKQLAEFEKQASSDPEKDMREALLAEYNALVA